MNEPICTPQKEEECVTKEIEVGARHYGYYDHNDDGEDDDGEDFRAGDDVLDHYDNCIHYDDYATKFINHSQVFNLSIIHDNAN